MQYSYDDSLTSPSMNNLSSIWATRKPSALRSAHSSETTASITALALSNKASNATLNFPRTAYGRSFFVRTLLTTDDGKKLFLLCSTEGVWPSTQSQPIFVCISCLAIDDVFAPIECKLRRKNGCGGRNLNRTGSVRWLPNQCLKLESAWVVPKI